MLLLYILLYFVAKSQTYDSLSCAYENGEIEDIRPGLDYSLSGFSTVRNVTFLIFMPPEFSLVSARFVTLEGSEFATPLSRWTMDIIGSCTNSYTFTNSVTFCCFLKNLNLVNLTTKLSV